MQSTGFISLGYPKIIFCNDCETRCCWESLWEYVTIVMEHYGDIIQTFQVGPTDTDYDPRRSAEMSVDILGYVGFIAPQTIIQVPSKLLSTRAQTSYEQICLMRKCVSATCHPGTCAFPAVLVWVPRFKSLDYLHLFHWRSHTLVLGGQLGCRNLLSPLPLDATVFIRKRQCFSPALKVQSSV